MNRPSVQFVILALAAALAAVGLFAGDAVAQTRSAAPFDWQGAIQPGQTIEVKGVNGSIVAVPATGRTARVSATRTARRSDPAEVQIEVVEHAGGVTVCAIYPSSLLRRNECLPGSEGRISSSNNDVRVEFEVQVPASVALAARTTNGSISTRGLTGAVDARSTNGDIAVLGGERVTARSTNGSIEIDSAGDAEARTTNGRISADLRSATGEGPLSFSTTNGSITLGLPADADLNIDARTSNGRINSDLPITVVGSFGRGRLTGTIGAGGREVRLRTTNGGIRLENGS